MSGDERLQPPALEKSCKRRAASSLQLVIAALDLLDEQQRDIPREKRVYRPKDIVNATKVADTDKGQGIKRSTLRRNPDVIAELRKRRGEEPEPEPDFLLFGAHRVVCDTSDRNREKRRISLAELERPDLAYWVVGYQELARHWNDVRSRIEAIDWPDGSWPKETEFPNPAFEIASTTGDRYHRLSTRETIEALTQMMLDLQEQVSEDLRIVENLQREYINQLLS